IKYEREKLIVAGRPDLSDLVEQVSLTDNTLGYDIKSFDIIDNQPIEIKIEVKTTTGNLENAFYLSLKEREVLQQYPETYKIYRVYKLRSLYPKFFIIDHSNINEFQIETALWKVY